MNGGMGIDGVLCVASEDGEGAAVTKPRRHGERR